MSVFLVGYMGSGKSIVGKNLARKLKFEYLDLDNYIEEQLGLTISDIFKTKGELFFRTQEQLFLKEVLGLQRTVVSLGGGTPCYGDNMKKLIESINVVIYLKASVDTLTGRLASEISTRPLINHLNNESGLNDFIRKHLFERNYYYQQAHHKIVVDGKSVEQIALDIIEILN
ncbi:shikimate kinase [Paucihalobacter sp.]|uniref:shikimate kinase n=1 Tax=Paucihalobacter sp. TaxID=2850405 RepID=UPI002FE26C64